MNAKENVTNKSGKVYAELLCDFMFKRLFGSEANKDVLIGFLNMIMEDLQIDEVEFIPTEHFGLTQSDRKAIFDISCRCKNGETLIIEMQKGYQDYFRERAVFYTSYPINEQGRLAKERYIAEHQSKNDDEEFRWDFNLKPVTVVAILNFLFDHDKEWPKDRYHSSYRLREDCTGEVMTEILRYVFLELGRFRKHIWELETTFDKWMYLLKNMHTLDSIPEKFDVPEFRRLFLLAQIGKFTPEEKEEYEKSLNSMSDFYNIIGSAERLARQEGLREGREEARLEAAKSLKENGVSVDVIAKSLTLPIELIEGL